MSTDTTVTDKTVTAKAVKAPIEISIAGVQQDLANGLDRLQIGEKYGLNKSQTKRVFMNPKLKGLKTKTVKVPFVLVDDAPALKIKAEAVTTTSEVADVKTTPEVETEKSTVDETKGVW